MAHIGGDRLVEGDPVVHQVAEIVKEDGGVVQIPVDYLPVTEAALDLQGVGQIPVVDGGVDLNASPLQGGKQAFIIVDPRGVDLTHALRQDAGPGEGQAVGLHAQLFEQGHVPLDVVIGVAADVRDAAVLDLAGQAAEHVPDGWAAPVFKGRAFDLLGGGGHAPDKVFGKRDLHRLCSSYLLKNRDVVNTSLYALIRYWLTRPWPAVRPRCARCP